MFHQIINSVNHLSWLIPSIKKQHVVIYTKSKIKTILKDFWSQPVIFAELKVVLPWRRLTR